MNTLVDVGAGAPDGQGADGAEKRPFPVVLVGGVAIVVLIMAAAAGVMCYRGRSKTAPPNAEQELSGNASNAQEPAAPRGHEGAGQADVTRLGLVPDGGAAVADAARVSVGGTTRARAPGRIPRGSDSGSPKSSTNEDSK